jgi:hypothetical protein
MIDGGWSGEGLCCSILDDLVEGGMVWHGMAWQIDRFGNGFGIGKSGTYMTFIEASNDAGAFFCLLRHRAGGCRWTTGNGCRQIFQTMMCRTL